uniref:Ig-like domain-containing protein n=1 Tax=Zosterops lateralis melanops TaxID=1220523 RepID=A0A8D2QLG1_ZOSLA
FRSGSLISMTPVLTLHPPSREEFQGPDRNSSLLCQIRGPRPLLPGHAHIRWLRNGSPVNDGPAPELPAPTGVSGLYVTGSRLVVSEAEAWPRSPSRPGSRGRCSRVGWRIPSSCSRGR